MQMIITVASSIVFEQLYWQPKASVPNVEKVLQGQVFMFKNQKYIQKNSSTQKIMIPSKPSAQTLGKGHSCADLMLPLHHWRCH